MPKFRTKSIVVEAIRLDPCGRHRIWLPAEVDGSPSPGADNWAYGGCRFFVNTAEGRLEAFSGDWIVTEEDGKRFLLSDENFRAHYEACGPEGDEALSHTSFGIAWNVRR